MSERRYEDISSFPKFARSNKRIANFLQELLHRATAENARTLIQDSQNCLDGLVEQWKGIEL
jgi:hypothetical protein